MKFKIILIFVMILLAGFVNASSDLKPGRLTINGVEIPYISKPEAQKIAAAIPPKQTCKSLGGVGGYENEGCYLADESGQNKIRTCRGNEKLVPRQQCGCDTWSTPYCGNVNTCGAGWNYDSNSCEAEYDNGNYMYTSQYKCYKTYKTQCGVELCNQGDIELSTAPCSYGCAALNRKTIKFGNNWCEQEFAKKPGEVSCCGECIPEAELINGKCVKFNDDQYLEKALREKNVNLCANINNRIKKNVCYNSYAVTNVPSVVSLAKGSVDVSNNPDVIEMKYVCDNLDKASLVDRCKKEVEIFAKGEIPERVEGYIVSHIFCGDHHCSPEEFIALLDTKEFTDKEYEKIEDKDKEIIQGQEGKYFLIKFLVMEDAKEVRINFVWWNKIGNHIFTPAESANRPYISVYDPAHQGTTYTKKLQGGTSWVNDWIGAQYDELWVPVYNNEVWLFFYGDKDSLLLDYLEIVEYKNEN